MPTYDNEILEAALIGYEHQKREIETKIEQIRAHLGGHVAPKSEIVSGSKPTFSAATRKRMAAAQQKRWASKSAEAETAPAEAAAPVEATAKATKKATRTPMSAEGRERIAAAQRKRWAKTKKAAKK
jgi:hypothetical protein